MLLLAVQFSDTYYWFPTAVKPIKMLHFGDGVHGLIRDIYDWFIKCCAITFIFAAGKSERET
jgi:hypothetical protein